MGVSNLFCKGTNMKDIIKQLTAAADNPIQDGVKAIVDLFKERFGDLKPADQASIMAFIGGGTILDVMMEEVGKITARMGQPDAGRSFTATAMSIQTAQEIASAGVISAFTASMNNAKAKAAAKKEGPKA